jgi:hypothetical protein
MTEDDWLVANDPMRMLDFLRSSGEQPVRKFRLFAVACCRKITPLMLKTELGYRAVVIAERLADGLPVAENLGAFRHRLCVADYDFRRIDGGFPPRKAAGLIYSAGGAAYHALDEESALLDLAAQKLGGAGVLQVPQHAAEAVAHWQRRTDRDRPAQAAFHQELREIVPLVHDIFGNPFRPLPPLSASLLDWHGGVGVQLARAIYEERSVPSGHLDAARLAVLADMLEEAGSTDAQLLGT